MQTNRLDLAALRGLRLPRPPSPEASLSHIVQSEETTPLSRRELLGMAGVAAVALQPGGTTVKSGLLGPFAVEGDDRRVVFSLGGKPRWVVDVRRFGGAPTLQMSRSERAVQVVLKGATYPGTDLPADFACEIRPAVVGWQMRLQMKLGGFDASVPFERWLAGEQPARTRVNLDAVVCRLDGDARARLRGAAEADFFPNWTLRLHGGEIASVSALGATLASDCASLCVLGPDAPSAMAAPPAKRTVLSLDRGNHPWALEKTVATPEGALLVSGGDPFDVVRVEVGEGKSAATQSALVAEGNGDRPCLSYCPGKGLRGDDERAPGLPLCNPRYGIAFDGAGEEAALMADHHADPVWVHTKTYSLQVGGGESVAPFELVSRGGVTEQVNCAPALLSFSAPLDGAIAGQAVPTSDTRVEFAQLRLPTRKPRVVKPKPEEEQKPKKPTPSKATTTVAPPTRTIKPVQPATRAPVARPGVKIDPGKVIVRPGLGIGTIPLDTFVVPITRARDLLSLQFQFKNLKLETGEEAQGRLVRRDPSKPAYIAIEFPPQHIAEQAFLEEAPEVDNPDAQQGEPLRAPPVRSRLSGASRLVFEVPDTVSQIPYTLPALLDWSQYDLSVAPTALPPPQRRAAMVPRRGRVIRIPSVIERPGSRALPLREGVQPDAGTMLRRRGDIEMVARSSGGVIVASPGLQVARPAIAGLVGLVIAPIEEPTRYQTAIEAPYRLILSPNRTAGWLHATSEVTHEGSTELWHTRLGVKSKDGRVYDNQYTYGPVDNEMRVIEVSATGDRNDYYRTLRAIWSPDYSAQNPPAHSNAPFRMSLDGRDRHELVALTSDFNIRDARARIVNAERFMLSSLGVWMNVRYGAEVPLGQGLSVEEWRHQAAMARDQYVRVVYKGYLFPFGHRASLVKVTERKFERRGALYIAYLRQRFFIVVREPEKAYPAHGQANDARGMPFRKCTITTLVTPTLDEAEGILPPRIASEPPNTPEYSAQAAFWVRTGNKDFLFHMVSEDWDGERVEFTAPMIFVGAENDVAFKRATMNLVRDEYNSEGSRPRREREMLGQKVAYAESSADKPGDTTFETETATFKAEMPPSGLNPRELEKQNQPRVFPVLQDAKVRIAAVVQMTGSGEAVPVQIDDAYVNKGWDAVANKGQVFMKLLEDTGLAFPGDKSGGVISPDLSIKGLSRQFGPIGGDISKLAEGVFDPEDFFKDAKAKILGGIDLAKILKAVFGDVKVPQLTVRPIFPDNNPLLLPEAVETKLVWEPEAKEFTIFKPHSNCKIKLTGLLRTELANATSTYEVTASITKFKVDVYFIIVDFDKFKFVTKSGKKPDVDVDIKDVAFGGPLEFVNELRESLSSGGGDSALGGFSLDVNLKGVSVGYSLAIPDVSVGVMSLQNMKLSAGITLPFTGDPVRLRFAFNERQNPFLLTVSMFGGGGFFGLEVSPRGMELMEASFEFGGNFSMNIGIASGGAYVMAGVYFKLERNDDTDTMDVMLTGYLRCGGHLEILKIITISCEFYLSLTYEVTGGRSRVWGQASLKVSIKILFFSKSVTLKVEREFAGSSGGHAESLDGARLAGLLDGPGALAQLRGRPRSGTSGAMTGEQPPTFADLMQQSDWQTYCEAFA